ncbi:sensor histidine kinase [Cryptosporangium sp. NPDC051539]|uniref:sensor histidine kinase n=1 Tax=Cryptosporangium sp. NPDC051539 TaxID=3363962 RepID=UPI0037A6142E
MKRDLLRTAGAWRLTYEVALALLLTGGATYGAAADPVYPLAPWLLGPTVPIVWLLRLTRPTTAYVAAALIGLGTGGESMLLLAVFSATFGYRAGTARHLSAGLAGAWICWVGSGWWWSEPDALFLSGIFVVVALLPAGVARLVRRQRALVTTMHRRNEQLHRQRSEIARRAQARERTRIARDLHDSLGHKLTLISLYAAMPRGTEQEARDHADLLRETSSSAMTELRQILGILRQDDEQPSVRPLSGLDELAANARASGAQVRFEPAVQARPLSSLTEHAAYRVIQEGLTNALRHAHGGEIVLTLRYEPDALIAAVVNSAGRRVAGTTSGQGLLGLAERVRVAGGVLHHGPTPDGGFRLAATLPYPVPDGAAGEPEPLPPGSDFADVMDRTRRRSRLALIATALGICGLLAFCVAGAWISTALVTVDRHTYDSVHLGQPEDDVRSVLPDEDAGDPGVTGGRPVPGATCIDYQASLREQLDAAVGGGLVYRFCYRGGRLVDKQAFRASR